MIAVDTNVVVRFLTGDDPAQAATAINLFAVHSISIGRTVLLESEWVLRHGYRRRANEIADAFTLLLGLETVTISDRSAVMSAVIALRDGWDFADALHLHTAAPDVTEFATFDRDFARRAAPAAGLPAVRLLETAT